jgi:hypothetical protein
MIRVLTTMVLVVAAATAQATPPSSPQNGPAGSIGGVVHEQTTGTPIADVDVFASPGQTRTKTDSHGRYALRALNPGLYTIHVFADQGRGGHASKVIALGGGQTYDAADFYLAGQAEIAGKVLDENNEPLQGMRVFLIAREYVLGTLRYVFTSGTTTDDRGEYRLRRVEPGRDYLVSAGNRARQVDAISDAPKDPKLRRPTLIRTYYPDTPSLEGAQPLVLRSAERREGIDVHMSRGLNYCIDGVLEAGGAPAALSFFIGQRQPANGDFPPGGTSGPDGRIRICDLTAGEYQITVMRRASAPQNAPSLFATGLVVIADRDVHNVTAEAKPQVHVSGEVVWAATPPDQPVDSKLAIRLEPLARNQFMGESTDAQPSIPGQFSLPSMFMDDYAPSIHGFPQGAYLKDITYAGLSIAHEPLRLGSAVGSPSLRIVLARDGGSLSAKVTDKDGNPAPDAFVMAIPKGASSEASLAAELISGQTDQYGTYTSGSLAPGKYQVLATNAPVDESAEGIGKLWSARAHGAEIDIGPNATVQITLTPQPLGP